MKKEILIGLILVLVVLAIVSIYYINQKEDLDRIPQPLRCSVDSDCVKYEGCCDCNHGGEATAVNVEFSNNFAKDCFGMACPAVISDDPSCFAIPKCVNNKC